MILKDVDIPAIREVWRGLIQYAGGEDGFDQWRNFVHLHMEDGGRQRVEVLDKDVPQFMQEMRDHHPDVDSVPLYW